MKKNSGAVFLSVFLLAGCTATKSTWPLPEENFSATRAALIESDTVLVYTTISETYNLYKRSEPDLRIPFSKDRPPPKVAPLDVNRETLTRLANTGLPKPKEQILDRAKRSLSWGVNASLITFSHDYSRDLGTVGASAKLKTIVEDPNSPTGYNGCESEFEAQRVIATPDQKSTNINQPKFDNPDQDVLNQAMLQVIDDLLELISRHTLYRDAHTTAYWEALDNKLKINGTANYYSFNGTVLANMNYLTEGKERLHFYAKKLPRKIACGDEVYVAQTNYSFRDVMGAKYIERLRTKHPDLLEQNRKFYREQSLRNQQILIDGIAP